MGKTVCHSGAGGRARLGQGPEANLQVIVPAGHWQTATALEGDAGYALVGCVVAPGFDFEDFEATMRNALDWHD